MAGLVILDTPKPESRQEVIEALRLALEYATTANINSVHIRLNFLEGASVLISSDE